METQAPSRESKGGWDGTAEGSFAHHTVELPVLQPRGRITTMRKFFAAVMSAAMVASFSPLAGARQDTQAPRSQDVQAPRGQNVQAPRGQDVQAPRSQDTQAPRSQDVQAPRGQNVQAPRSQDVQAPRSQDAQAPRSQDVQAPRSQDVQSPRGQNVQAPRSQDVQAPRSQDAQAPRSLAGSQAGGGITKAAQLVKDAEAACKAGDAKTAKDKAIEALAILK